MPLYRITAPNGVTYETEGPEGATPEQVKAVILQAHPEAGTPKQEENLLEKVPLVGSTLAGIADIPLSAVQGLAGTSKTLTDLFGADNAASGFLGDVTRLAGELKSSGSREDAATAAAIQKEAEDKGIWEQVKAAAKSFAETLKSGDAGLSAATAVAGLGSATASDVKVTEAAAAGGGADGAAASSKKLSGGAIAGIAVGSVAGAAILAGAVVALLGKKR
jgi:hypothetical protein